MAKADAALKLALEKPDFREIVAGQDDYSTKMYDGLFYVHNVVEYKTLKKETMEFVAKHFADTVDLGMLKKLSDTWFASIGKFCYIANYGAKLTDKDISSIERIANELTASNNARLEAAALKAEAEEEAAPTVTTPKPGIQDYMRD